MVLSTPAPHGPFTPAPQYAKQFANQTAPRTLNFNKVDLTKENRKHWLINSKPTKMSDSVIEIVSLEGRACVVL